jgi:hypothetical protein
VAVAHRQTSVVWGFHNASPDADVTEADIIEALEPQGDEVVAEYREGRMSREAAVAHVRHRRRYLGRMDAAIRRRGALR